jgi:PhzF family phenazine biosynthesis protein
VKSFSFSQVDVFSPQPQRGNPVAVVHDADGLTAGEMATFARWTNLSETTFLLTPENPDADYRLRIFTPGGELPFAGHPTLGSCHAWLSQGGVPAHEEAVIQECEVGLVRIRRGGARLAFSAPPLRRAGPLEADVLERILAATGLAATAVRDHQWVDNGPGWCALLLDSAKTVLSVDVDLAALGDLSLGLVGPQLPGADSDFEVRAFVPSLGVPEDPVTGSLNASIGQWLTGAGIARKTYVAAQGTRLDRVGRVHIDASSGDAVWVGGDTRTLITGSVTF